VVSGRGSQSWTEAEHPCVLAPGKRPRLTPNPALAEAHLAGRLHRHDRRRSRARPDPGGRRAEADGLRAASTCARCRASGDATPLAISQRIERFLERLLG